MMDQSEATELGLLTQAYRDCAQQEHAWRKKRLDAAERIRILLAIPGRGTTLFATDAPPRSLTNFLELSARRLPPSKRRQRRQLEAV